MISLPSNYDAWSSDYVYFPVVGDNGLITAWTAYNPKTMRPVETTANNSPMTVESWLQSEYTAYKAGQQGKDYNPSNIFEFWTKKTGQTPEQIIKNYLGSNYDVSKFTGQSDTQENNTTTPTNNTNTQTPGLVTPSPAQSNVQVKPIQDEPVNTTGDDQLNDRSQGGSNQNYVMPRLVDGTNSTNGSRKQKGGFDPNGNFVGGGMTYDPRSGYYRYFDEMTGRYVEYGQTGNKVPDPDIYPLYRRTKDGTGVEIPTPDPKTGYFPDQPHSGNGGSTGGTKNTVGSGLYKEADKWYPWNNGSGTTSSNNQTNSNIKYSRNNPMYNDSTYQKFLESYNRDDTDGTVGGNLVSSMGPQGAWNAFMDYLEGKRSWGQYGGSDPGLGGSYGNSNNGGYSVGNSTSGITIPSPSSSSAVQVNQNTDPFKSSENSLGLIKDPNTENYLKRLGMDIRGKPYVGVINTGSVFDTRADINQNNVNDWENFDWSKLAGYNTALKKDNLGYSLYAEAPEKTYNWTDGTSNVNLDTGESTGNQGHMDYSANPTQQVTDTEKQQFQDYINQQLNKYYNKQAQIQAGSTYSQYFNQGMNNAVDQYKTSDDYKSSMEDLDALSKYWKGNKGFTFGSNGMGNTWKGSDLLGYYKNKYGQNMTDDSSDLYNGFEDWFTKTKQTGNESNLLQQFKNKYQTDNPLTYDEWKKKNPNASDPYLVTPTYR